MFFNLVWAKIIEHKSFQTDHDQSQSLEFYILVSCDIKIGFAYLKSCQIAKLPLESDSFSSLTLEPNSPGNSLIHTNTSGLIHARCKSRAPHHPATPPKTHNHSEGPRVHYQSLINTWSKKKTRGYRDELYEENHGRWDERSEASNQRDINSELSIPLCWKAVIVTTAVCCPHIWAEQSTGFWGSLSIWALKDMLHKVIPQHSGQQWAAPLGSLLQHLSVSTQRCECAVLIWL